MDSRMTPNLEKSLDYIDFTTIAWVMEGIFTLILIIGIVRVSSNERVGFWETIADLFLLDLIFELIILLFESFLD